MEKEKFFEWNYLTNPEFVVLDLETTGFSYEKGSRIIEIGAVKFKNGVIIDRYSTFINPELKIPAKITQITSITNNMVKDAPFIASELPKFKKFIGDLLIIAHNAQFDWDRFLIPAFKSVGIIPTNNVLDTIVLSKYTFQNEKKHNLQILCSRLGVCSDGHHRAINDAEMTGNCYLKLIDLNKNKIPKTLIQEGFVIVEDKEVFNPEIKRVSYWEMKNSKRLIHSRQYIVLKNGKSYGTVFYNIINNTWHNKDYNSNIDFDIVEKKVLLFLGLNSIEDLKKYRN